MRWHSSERAQLHTAGLHKLLMISETKQLFIIAKKEFLAILQGHDAKWGNVYGKQHVNCKVPFNPGLCFNISSWEHWKFISSWVLVSGGPGCTSILSPSSNPSELGFCICKIKILSIILNERPVNCSGYSVEVDVYCFFFLRLWTLGVMASIKSSRRNCPQEKKAFKVHFCAYE